MEKRLKKEAKGKEAILRIFRAEIEALKKVKAGSTQWDGSRGPSLCIFCKNCMGKCNWSESFKEVKGRYADVEYEEDLSIKRAWVGWCPEFIPDKGLHELFTQKKDKDKVIKYLTKQYGVMTPKRYATMRYHFINTLGGIEE